MLRLSTLTVAVVSFSVVAGAASAAAVSDADRSFLVKDVQGARYELALGKLAQSKASKPDVRSYASMIVRDHTSANASLAQLAQQEGVTVPSGMTPEDAQSLAKIKEMQGASFDKSYIDEMTQINLKDEADSNQEQSSTQNARIKAYLKKFAAMDAKHKKVGEELKASVG